MEIIKLLSFKVLKFSTLKKMSINPVAGERVSCLLQERTPRQLFLIAEGLGYDLKYDEQNSQEYYEYILRQIYLRYLIYLVDQVKGSVPTGFSGSSNLEIVNYYVNKLDINTLSNIPVNVDINPDFTNFWQRFLLLLHTTRGLSVNTLESTIVNFTSGKPSIIPQFIVTYGPPASGKTSTLKMILNEIKVDPNSVVHVNVDSIVDSIPEYQKEIQQVVEALKRGEALSVIENLSASIYFKYRPEADVISTLILLRAIVNKNHIVFETTGGSKWSISWLLKIRRTVSDLF